MLERPGADVGLGSGSGRRFKQRGLFPFQEFFPPPGISSEGGWTLLLPCRKGLLALPGVQGEGEGRADGERELEDLALTCMCMA